MWLSYCLLCKTITVESGFLEPPRETKNGSKNHGEVREIGGKITEKFDQGKRNSVPKIERFESRNGGLEKLGFYCVPLTLVIYELRSYEL